MSYDVLGRSKQQVVMLLSRTMEQQYWNRCKFYIPLLKW